MCTDVLSLYRGGKCAIDYGVCRLCLIEGSRLDSTESLWVNVFIKWSFKLPLVDFRYALAVSGPSWL